MKTKARPPVATPVEILWSHAGVTRRVTAWPEVRFERQCGDQWLPDTPDEGSFAAAAADVREITWRRYLDYLPAAERAFIAQFRIGRLEALQVLARCPDLLPILADAPALTVFVSAHMMLRGYDRPGWAEINALFHRAGIFGLLEWLGLPATRQVLTTLRNFADPEIPRRLLAPLRTVLWDQATLTVLAHSNVVTDVDLVRHCHRLAA